MRRNCNLELGLFPPYSSNEDEDEGIRQQQQITIFYAGKICVSHVTELQAKSILMLANKKVEEKAASTPMTTTTSTTPTSRSNNKQASSSPPIIVQSNNTNNNQLLYGTGTGLSMKKSLQRFLQKRKIRIQEASPYNR